MGAVGRAALDTGVAEQVGTLVGTVWVGQWALGRSADSRTSHMMSLCLCYRTHILDTSSFGKISIHLFINILIGTTPIIIE